MATRAELDTAVDEVVTAIDDLIAALENASNADFAPEVDKLSAAVAKAKDVLTPPTPTDEV